MERHEKSRKAGEHNKKIRTIIFRPSGAKACTHLFNNLPVIAVRQSLVLFPGMVVTARFGTTFKPRPVTKARHSLSGQQALHGAQKYTNPKKYPKVTWL